jgi:hypothetical protein
MWPFRKKQKSAALSSQSMGFSQLDSTERFDDSERLGPEDWIETFALNSRIENPTTMGLPALGTGEDETYRVAAYLSGARDYINIPGDGVYCPICHIANTSLSRLRTPCPKCSRPLLRFGWT